MLISQHQEQDLCNIMVALKITKLWVSPQNLGNDILKLLLSLVQLFLGLLLWIVHEGSVHVKLDLIFIVVGRKVFP